MVIMKFGGTSVEDAPAIERVAEIVRSRGKDDPVVVVSAFAKVTDQLVLMGQQSAATDCDSSLQLLRQLRDRHLATANQLLGSKLFPITASKVETMFAELENLVRGVAAVRELSLRSSDYLLSFGELLSSEIVTAALVARGCIDGGPVRCPVGISILDTGWAPYSAFLHHLPRLLSGEAFPAFRRPGSVAANLSVPGFLFKLKLFGLLNGSFALMKIIGSIYTVILLAATVAIGMRKPTRNDQPLIWLAVLILASLRSPFLPTYGIFPVL